MYRFFYFFRIFLTFALVIGAGAAIFYTISSRSYEEQVRNFYLQVTVAVATEIQETMYNVTRTAEAPMNAFQVIRLDPEQSLEEVARRFGTTVSAIQIANGIDRSVTQGDGQAIIVPVDMPVLNPPRIVEVYVAQLGDTLESIADRRFMKVSQLLADNPVLAQRGLIPGDTVFVSIELLD